jgi:hypothetical protein
MQFSESYIKEILKRFAFKADFLTKQVKRV